MNLNIITIKNLSFLPSITKIEKYRSKAVETMCQKVDKLQKRIALAKQTLHFRWAIKLYLQYEFFVNLVAEFYAELSLTCD